jgi:hypothetical protein
MCAIFMVLTEAAGPHLAVLDVPEGALALNGATIAVDILRHILPPEQ